MELTQWVPRYLPPGVSQLGLEADKSHNIVPRLNMSRDLLPLPLGLHGMHRYKRIFTCPVYYLFVTCCGLDLKSQVTPFHFSEVARHSNSFSNTWTSYGAHSMSTEIPSPWSKPAGAWSWQVTQYCAKIKHESRFTSTPLRSAWYAWVQMYLYLPSILFICNMLRIRFEITSDTNSSAVIAKCFWFLSEYSSW